MSTPPTSATFSFPWSAFLADSLTLLRLGVAIAILGLGWQKGAAALPAVVVLATVGWLADAYDGTLARRSARPTRLRRFDFPIDVSLTWAIFVYLALATFAPWPFVAVYTLLALATFAWRRRKAILVIFLRGIDILFAFIILRHALIYALPLLLWLPVLIYGRRQRLHHAIQQWLHDVTVWALPL